jgi:hypothetical protein
MYATVDGETSGVNREFGLRQLVAVQVDLHQAAGRDLVKHQAIRVDQKVVLGAGEPGADVGVDQVAPAIVRNQPVGGGQIDAQLPFFGADLALE